MPEPQPPPIFCEERKCLDQDLSKLLRSKSAIREQVSGEIIAIPAKRRATLVPTDEMIDDVIALMNKHYKHCSCERKNPPPSECPLSPVPGARRDQSRKSLTGFQIVRG